LPRAHRKFCLTLLFATLLFIANIANLSAQQGCAISDPCLTPPLIDPGAFDESGNLIPASTPRLEAAPSGSVPEEELSNLTEDERLVLAVSHGVAQLPDAGFAGQVSFGPYALTLGLGLRSSLTSNLTIASPNIGYQLEITNNVSDLNHGTSYTFGEGTVVSFTRNGTFGIGIGTGLAPGLKSISPFPGVGLSYGLDDFGTPPPKKPRNANGRAPLP
jgi:hypothetical protein